MEKIIRNWTRPNDEPLTIWSRKLGPLLPERIQRLDTFVMPVIYSLIMLFGIVTSVDPVPSFEYLVGTYYGFIWSILIGVFAGISLGSLIFRLVSEMYSAIALTFLLVLYPIFMVVLVIHEANINEFSRIGILILVSMMPIMPAWRSVDLMLGIRKSKQRQMYTEQTTGEVKIHAASNGTGGSS